MTGGTSAGSLLGMGGTAGQLGSAGLPGTAGSGSGGIGAAGGGAGGNAAGGAGAGGIGAAGIGAAGGGAGGIVAGGGGTAGSAGVAGASGTAGSGGTGVTEDECGPIPAGPPQAATPKAAVQYGLVEYHTAETNTFVGVHATLTVPAKPPPTGVIFVWPGTQPFPDSPTYQPVAGGVLQPVLTWGQSCVPGALAGHSTWWISPVYVNDETTISDLQGCHGGSVITADVGDHLDLDMHLDGTNWNQTVVDRNSTKSTTFRIDLRGQQQQRTLFWIELKSTTKPTEDVIFDHVVLTMQTAEPGACALNNGGINDYATKSRVSADGFHCCIGRIVLRAQGVPATTTNP